MRRPSPTGSPPGPSERVRTWSAYERVFLTKERQPRQRDVISAVAFPSRQRRSVRSRRACPAGSSARRPRGVAERTAALLRIGAAVLEAYDRRKRADRRARFRRPDRVQPAAARAARASRPGCSYKLDQQIDHLLVDEGQDTSPEQWAIIEALCAEFFVGEGARALQRTLFVVGDEKQSIMSVQGADVGELSPVPRSYSRRARAAAGSRGARSRSAGRSARPGRSSIWSTRFLPSPTARDGVVSGDGWPRARMLPDHRARPGRSLAADRGRAGRQGRRLAAARSSMRPASAARPASPGDRPADLRLAARRTPLPSTGAADPRRRRHDSPAAARHPAGAADPRAQAAAACRSPAPTAWR